MATNIVIPMAGLGSRLPPSRYGTIKPLIPIGGVPMIKHVVESLNLSGRFIFIYRQNDFSYKLKKVLLEIDKVAEILVLDKLTKGPVETCLSAKHLINNNSDLVIANADQIMRWSSVQFIKATQKKELDGLIVTYTSTSHKNSFASLNNQGYVSRIKEKEVISDIALVGIHYWRRGSDFVESAEDMISQKSMDFGEYYIGPSYNQLIQKGLKIGVHHIPSYQYNPVGIPEDLEKYKEELCKNII